MNNPDVIKYSIKTIDEKIAKLNKNIGKLNKSIEQIEDLHLSNLKLFLNSIGSEPLKKFTEKSIEKELENLRIKNDKLEKYCDELAKLQEIRDKLPPTLIKSNH